MSAADNLTAARAAGVAMGSIHRGAHIGWTTDPDAAAQLRIVTGIMVTNCRGGARGSDRARPAERGRTEARVNFCPYCGVAHERKSKACCPEHGYKAAGMAAAVTRGRNRTHKDYMAALQARLRHVPTFRKAALGELTPEQAALQIFGVEPADSFNDPSEGQP